MRRILFAFGILLAAAAGAPAATACDSCAGSLSGLPGLYGYGFSGNLYGLGRIPVPPYFALHPPVYYSEQVARPYGLSPFAYRSAPVEAHRAQPAMITNPFVSQPPATQPEAAEPAKDPVAAHARVIVNPYVDAGSWQVAHE